MKFTKKIKDNQQGVTAVSFAILLPVLVLLLIGIVQLGIIMVIQNALEAAARQASRYGIVGTPSSTQARSAAITSEIMSVVNAYSGGIVNTSKLVITTTSYTSLANTTSGTTNSVGASGQAVLYNISYVYDTLYPIFFTTNTLVTLRASALVANENF